MIYNSIPFTLNHGEVHKYVVNIMCVFRLGRFSILMHKLCLLYQVHRYCITNYRLSIHHVWEHFIIDMDVSMYKYYVCLWITHIGIYLFFNCVCGGGGGCSTCMFYSHIV